MQIIIKTVWQGRPGCVFHSMYTNEYKRSFYFWNKQDIESLQIFRIYFIDNKCTGKK